MASSRDRHSGFASFPLVVPALGLLLAAGCSVGAGEGTVTGTVNAPGCGLEGAPLALDPTFFSAEPIDDAATPEGSLLTLRIQHGSGTELVSDGLDIVVPDAADVKLHHLGQPVAVGPQAPNIGMNLFLNATCPSGPRDQAVNYVAVGGTITFRNIYAPTVSTSEVEIAGSFSGVHLEDPSQPGDRWATIDGTFRFLFNRGRPAQRFP